jgi:hypothetical protein
MLTKNIIEGLNLQNETSRKLINCPGQTEFGLSYSSLKELYCFKNQSP